ncbi:MAG: hypothetical protein QM728_09290 [Gordonia sp. (in: high G+C Gram-positive bacteria)]|uniref:hypothetical protein n=1 Tax=Gordonia sp. (in: high G+C Gram-positive bacteria) TaxID=84139 RepID=UPI0039E440F8
MATDKQKAARAAERERAASIAEGNWVPSPENKSKATWFRVAAILLWIAAIAVEIYLIFKIIVPGELGNKFTLAIILLVVMAAGALVGNLLWKKANHLDPASEKNKFRFFVQNQLGAIITILAFLPLIVLIFMDKNIDGKQKGILGGLAVILGAAVAVSGMDFNAISSEQIARERNVVQALTGQDNVWYSKKGSKFHVCEKAALITGRVQQANLTHGTVEQAHADGVSELTKLWVSEARNHCNVPEDRIQYVLSGAGGTLTSDDLDKTVDDKDKGQIKAPASLPKKAPVQVPSIPVPAPNTQRPAA